MPIQKVNRRRFIRQIGMGTALGPLWSHRSKSVILGANERLRIGVIGCGNMAAVSGREALCAEPAPC